MSERDHFNGIGMVTVIVRSSALSARLRCRCRARLVEADSTMREWCNQTLSAYKRLTKQAVRVG
jgi:hypothetical protein